MLLKRMCDSTSELEIKKTQATGSMLETGSCMMNSDVRSEDGRSRLESLDYLKLKPGLYGNITPVSRSHGSK